MLRDVQVIADPPPNGVFTFEDTVTGKVLFESHRDEKLAWCEVFFHAWVSTHVVKQTHNLQNSQVPNSNYKDKDVLFQTSAKVYVGDGNTLHKNIRYEWPFQFDFRAELEDAESLPSSGKYGNSSVEYKIIAIPITPAQSVNCEQVIHAMMNPNEQLHQKESPVSMTGVFMFAAKHLGGAAEQEIRFAKIRPEGLVDGHLLGPFRSSQEIGVHHLPYLQQTSDLGPERRGIFPREPHIPFNVDLDLPRNIIEGSYFPMLLNVTSPTQAWSDNPPPATLIALKVHMVSRTIERASFQSQEFERRISLLDTKGLNIPLGGGVVDLGHVFPVRIVGDGTVPSFDTRLLTRKYDLLVEATIEVAGKQFHAKFHDIKNIELLSRHIAVGQPAATFITPPKAKEKVVLQLSHSYIGRITQNSNGPVKEASVMEAALAVSRALTKYEVPHEFPGGSLVKILPYRFDRHRTNNSNFDKTTDQEKVETVFKEDSTLKVMPHDSWSVEDMLKVKLNYFDAERGEELTILFPTFLIRDDTWQKEFAKQTRCSADAIKLDPVSLFNYRLSCAILRGELSDPELGDFERLYWAFSKDLHHHRKNIDVNAARIAVERYPQIEKVLLDIGVDPNKGKVKEQERIPPPRLENSRGVEPGYEEGLVKEMKKHSFFHRKH